MRFFVLGSSFLVVVVWYGPVWSLGISVFGSLGTSIFGSLGILQMPRASHGDVDVAIGFGIVYELFLVWIILENSAQADAEVG